MKNINDLLKEADCLIEKTASASKNTQPNVQPQDDDVTSLAGELEKLGMELQGSTKVASLDLEETPFEKIAHAIAIMETIDEIENEKQLEKIASVALDKGFSQEEVDAFVQEKRASYTALHQRVVIPEGLNA